MAISSRSVLVVAPVLGVNAIGGIDFQRMVNVLAQVCIDCLEPDGSHGADCEEAGCHEYVEPFNPNQGQISLTSFLGNSPLANSSIENARHHFDCFNNDGDGDECSDQDESENNMDTIKTSLKLLQTYTIRDEELLKLVNAGASNRLALRTSVADSEKEDGEEPVQPSFLDNFDLWLKTINDYVASLTEEEQVAIVDTFEPLTIDDFKKFLSVLYSFDFETQTPTEDDIKDMMRWVDGFLDATHDLFFEHEKEKDDDGDNDTLYGQTKDVLVGRATRHTFMAAA